MPAVRDPSTPRVPPQVVTPAPARQALPVLALHLVRDPALEHLAPAVLPVQAAPRPQARPHAHSAAHHPVDAAVARSIQKPRKAR